MTLINNNGDFYATKLFKVTSQTLATYLLLPTILVLGLLYYLFAPPNNISFLVESDR
jgi:hypothetical protein